MTEEISFPPLFEVPAHQLDTQKRHLLAEIAREPERLRFSAPSLPRHRFSQRRLVMACVLAISLAAPALALSGVLGSTFGFSNQGTPVRHKNLDTIHSLRATSARPGSFVKLASREGISVYGARSKKGKRLCFYWGPNAGTGSCLAPADFPSPALPVWDMSVITGEPPYSITHLVGVAADGVASIQVLDRDCQPVATVPVIDNVYIDVLKPMAPKIGLFVGEPYIVARDSSGKLIWHRKVLPLTHAPSCGLG
jgi:hypothetical protein